MATGSAGAGSLPTPTAAGTSAQPAKRERYIDRQLRRTRRQVRGVELASRMMLLVAAAVAFFLVAAVVDHWLVPGGLSIYGRLAFLAVFLVGAGWFAAHEIAPLFVYRINPLYAAQTIERAKPTLKNSLLNFLMLKSNRAGLPDVVLNAVEEQAAANLERTSIDHVVDRTRLIHIGYLLLAMVSAFCTYYLLSPKSPLQTVGRVVLPWSDLQPASRVEIDDIQPGTTTVFRGERVNLSAAVSGLNDDEAATLYFSTADRQSVDQPLRMYVSKDSYGRHAVTLPAADAAPSIASAGLQQDIEYRIEAGDAVSRAYRLTVVQAPNIVVEKLEYSYPEYTRRDPETVEKTGDIRAVEGTQVTIHALANQPIASAYLDFGGGGLTNQPMKIASDRASGQRATATITLALNEDRTAPVFSHYLVRFVTDRGHENPEPIRYRIEVTPDPAPELQVLRPDKVETTVPLNAPVAFEVDATDELYGLADVRIIANVGGESAFQRNKSGGRGGEPSPRLVFKHLERLDRVTLDGGKKLKPGDVIEYWAEAVDNKTPRPNVTKTEVRKLVIAQPQPNQNQNQEPQENEGDGQDQNRQQNDGQDGNNERQDQPGENNEQQKNNQQKSDQRKDQKNDAAKNGDSKNDDGGKGRGNPEQEQPNNDLDQRKGRDAPNDQKRGADNAKQQRGNEKSGDSGDEQDKSTEDGAQNAPADDTKGAKRDGTDQGNTDQANGQRGDPSEKDADDEQRNEPGDRSNDAQSNADRQNDSQGGEQKDDPRPVDKSDDGEALNRILDHAKKKDGKTPEQPDGANDEQRAASGDARSDEQKSNDAQAKSDDGKSDDGKSDDGKRDDGKRDDSQAKSPAEQQNKGDDQANQKRDQQQEKRDADKSGAGSKLKKDDGKTTGEPQPSQEKDSQEGAKTGVAKGDQSKQENKGAEKQTDRSDGGAKSPQKDRRPKTDQPPAAGDGAKNPEEENLDDKTKKQSGGGAKGSRENADKGKGTSNDRQPGAGDTGEEPGNDKNAKDKSGSAGTKKTDKSGTKKESGGESGTADDGQKKTGPPNPSDPPDQKQPSEQPGAKGGQPGNEKNDLPGDEKNGTAEAQKDGQPADQPADDGGDKGGSDKGGTPKNAPEGRGSSTGGGGTPKGDPPPPPDRPRVQPSDDKANLEYAKRATDLALDHLRNQLEEGQPDEELLDRLGWSKEDLQKLLSRWEKMEREAKQSGPTGNKAKENLQEAIKSLGWKRPGQTSREASSKADDAAHGLRDATRSAPPPEYAEQYRAFKKRTSRGEK